MEEGEGVMLEDTEHGGGALVVSMAQRLRVIMETKLMSCCGRPSCRRKTLAQVCVSSDGKRHIHIGTSAIPAHLSPRLLTMASSHTSADRMLQSLLSCRRLHRHQSTEFRPAQVDHRRCAALYRYVMDPRGLHGQPAC